MVADISQSEIQYLLILSSVYRGLKDVQIY